MDAPGTVTSWVRRKLSADVVQLCSDRPGQRELEDRHRRRAVVDDERRLGARAAAGAGSSATPRSPARSRCRGCAFGCRKILTIAWPLTVVDSMCSMLSTVVVRTRSNCVVMRPSISSGFRPVNCQATAITGMSMFGKMSVGVRRMTTGTDDQDQQRQHDEGVGALQRDPDDPHVFSMQREAAEVSRPPRTRGTHPTSVRVRALATPNSDRANPRSRRRVDAIANSSDTVTRYEAGHGYASLRAARHLGCTRRSRPVYQSPGVWPFGGSLRRAGDRRTDSRARPPRNRSWSTWRPSESRCPSTTVELAGTTSASTCETRDRSWPAARRVHRTQDRPAASAANAILGCLKLFTMMPRFLLPTHGDGHLSSRIHQRQV